MTSMRVLVNGWFWGQMGAGSGQYLTQLLNTLPQVAPETDILVALPRRRFIGRDRHPALPSGCRRVVLRTPFDGLSKNLSKVWFEQLSFRRACEKLNVDVAFVPYWASPLNPLVPTVVTIHDLIPLLLPQYRGSLPIRLYTRLVSTSAERATSIIAVSEATRQDILEHLQVDADRVRVVHEAAPRGMARSDESQISAIRRKYGLPDRFLLYLGGFDIRKNLVGLLKAYAQIVRSEDSDDYALVVAGGLPRSDGEFRPDPRRIARQMGIEQWVWFPGWIDETDKAALYSAATAFVFPSHYEGFGLPVLEAMSCGTPVIASRSTSLPEIVGGAGFLVSPKKTTELAAAMQWLWQDRDQQQRLGNEAAARAREFSWERAARETAAVYTAASDRAG